MQDDRSAGQIGIIILLLTVVLLTIGLSIASRSVTDVRLSRQEEETSRAFDAAEAGIEDALRKDLQALVTAPQSDRTISVGGIDAVYEVDEQPELETELDVGETVEVNLENYTGTQVSIEWGWDTDSCPNHASIVVAVYNATTGTIRRTPYKGCDRVPDDNFQSSAAAVTAGYEYQVLENVDYSAGDEYMRIRAVYNSMPIRIAGQGTDLPAQYWRIHSEAQTLGGETRAVEVTQTVPAPPSIFDFVLFSGANLIK